MDTAPVPAGSTVDFETLIRDLNHRIWEVRRDACEELGLRGDRQAIQQLVRLLKDSVGAVRYSAVEALGKLGDKSVIGQLVPLLEDPNFGAYGPLIEALANLKATEAVPHLLKLLRDRDPRVRSLTANALMVITRQVLPFKAKGSEEERETGVKMWEAWWQKNKESLKH